MVLEGKVAMVTGGGRGLGKAYCLALLNEGVKVCICDINEEESSKLINSLPERLRSKIIYNQCDVTDYNNFRDAFENTVTTFGKIDIVVNNAGVCDEINWRKTIDINFIGVVHGIQLGIQYMSLENGKEGGFIINTASVAGLSGSKFIPVYSATKHAVVGLTKSYGSEYHYKKTGVKVNAICPDAVDTYLLKNLASVCADEKEMTKYLKNKACVELEVIGQALIKVLEDNKNGSLLSVDVSGMKYV